MKRFSVVIKHDPLEGPYVEYIEDPGGLFVRASEAFPAAGYVWCYRVATWIKPEDLKKGDQYIGPRGGLVTKT